MLLMKKSLRNVILGIAATGILFGANSYLTISKELANTKEINKISSVEINNLNEKNQQLVALNEQLQADKILLQEQNASLEEEIAYRESRMNSVSRGSIERSISIECTAYCDGYATASGDILAGKSREEAMVVAVDPDFIPLGSTLYIAFDDPEWEHLSGYYKASDTGGAVAGNIVDIYMGDGAYSESMSFGRRSARVLEIIAP